MTRVILITIAAFIPALAYGNLVTNGDFESPVVTDDQGDWTGRTYSAGSDIGGWTVGGGGSVDLVSSFTAASGAQCVDLNGSGPGSIHQDLRAVEGGELYRLSFALSGNPQDPQSSDLQVRVWWAGFILDVISYPHTTTWTYHQYDVVGPFASLPIVLFESRAGTFWGPLVDDVSVVAVPEPATAAAALVLLGLLVGRRRTPRYR